jgi:hypothetical protein
MSLGEANPRSVSEPGFAHWPDGRTFLHNEGGQSARTPILADLRDADEVLIITGYAALDRVVMFLTEHGPGPSRSADRVIGTGEGLDATRR